MTFLAIGKEVHSMPGSLAPLKVGAGATAVATVFFVTYAKQIRKQRLQRMERKLDRLDDKTDELQGTS